MNDIELNIELTIQEIEVLDCELLEILEFFPDQQSLEKAATVLHNFAIIFKRYYLSLKMTDDGENPFLPYLKREVKTFLNGYISCMTVNNLHQKGNKVYSVTQFPLANEVSKLVH